MRSPETRSGALGMPFLAALSLSLALAFPTLGCDSGLAPATGTHLARQRQGGWIVTGPVDKAGFEALVAQTAPGDTIECRGGIYDFSRLGAVLLPHGVSIVAANENNPPVFVGATIDGTPDGEPLDPGGLPWEWNAAFAPKPDAQIDGLHLRGVHLVGFDRAIVLAHGLNLTEFNCPPYPDAFLRNVTVDRVTIRNSWRGIQAVNAHLDGLTIRDSEIKARNIAIIQLGGPLGCSRGGGGAHAGRVSGLWVENNVLAGTVMVFGAVEASIHDNYVSRSGGIGFYLGDWGDAGGGSINFGSIKRNTVTGATFGILAIGPTNLEGTEIAYNHVDNSAFAIFLEEGANGFEIKGNTSSGIRVAEVFLGYNEEDPYAFPPDTHHNKVELLAGDRYYDFGHDNVIELPGD